MAVRTTGVTPTPKRTPGEMADRALLTPNPIDLPRAGAVMAVARALDPAGAAAVAAAAIPALEREAAAALVAAAVPAMEVLAAVPEPAAAVAIPEVEAPAVA